MAHLLRLIVLALASFFSGFASAALPQIEVKSYYTDQYGSPSVSSWAYGHSSAASLCAAVFSREFANASQKEIIANDETQCSAKYMQAGREWIGWLQFTVNVLFTSSIQCPSGSSLSGGSCTCKSGFVETNGACKKKKSDQCGDLQGMSLGLPQMEINVGVTTAHALAGKIGKSGTSCFPGGCTVSGTVNGCLAVGSGSSGSVCFINNPTFTGEACDDKAKPDNGCPAGTSPSAYAAGVCIPDENNCPSGYSPSKYASGVCIPHDNPCPPGQSPSKYVQGVCLPNEDPDSTGQEEGDKNNCPQGYVPSRYVAGVCIPADKVVDKNGTTTCNGNVCTTVKPDGTTEEKPKETFCAENPESPLCVKGEFGGSCAAGFSCKGDAIQCAIAQQQHRRDCKLFEDKSEESDLYNANKGKTGNQTGELPGNETISLSGRIDTSDALGGGGCIADLSVTVWGQGVSLPLSNLCQYLAMLGNILVAVSMLMAARIVTRG